MTRYMFFTLSKVHDKVKVDMVIYFEVSFHYRYGMRNGGKRMSWPGDTEGKKASVRNEEGNGSQNASFTFMTV